MDPEVFTTERYLRDLREDAEAREAGAYAARRAADDAAGPAPGGGPVAGPTPEE